MKAVQFRKYGGSDVIEVAEIPDPAAETGQVLVEIHAASINPIDWKIREGVLQGVFDVPMPYVGGRDFSGVVRSTGDGVTGFAPGDAVFGAADPMRQGTHAELIAVDQKTVAPKPDPLTHAEAAAVVISGLSAVAALETAAGVSPGQKILIHAGAGGVGHMAIQFAKSLGATVVTTARAANHDFVRSCGADEVIDYATTDFETVVSDCDVVLDSIGGEVHIRSLGVLKPGGILAHLNAQPIPDYECPDHVTVVSAPVRTLRDGLDRLIELIEAEAMRPTISRRFRLDDAREAYDLSQSGPPPGKMVFEIK